MAKTLIEAKRPNARLLLGRRPGIFVNISEETHAALCRAAKKKNYMKSVLAREYVEYCLREEGYLQDKEGAESLENKANGSE